MQGGKAVAVGGDVSKAAEAQGIAYAAIKNYRRLDIPVNNSGVYEFAPLEAITEEHFHKLFNINVLGALLVTQAAAKHLGVASLRRTQPSTQEQRQLSTESPAYLPASLVPRRSA